MKTWFPSITSIWLREQIMKAVIAPATPAANQVVVYVDIADGLAKIKMPSGNVITIPDSVLTVAGASSVTANRAVASDGTGGLVASATTATELGYVSGVTSAIQTQLANKLSSVTKQVIDASGGDITTNSAVFSDVANATFTLPNRAGGVALIIFSFVISNGTLSAPTSFQILDNGVAKGLWRSDEDLSNGLSSVTIIWITTLSGQIVKLQWKTTAGTTTLYQSSTAHLVGTSMEIS